MPLLRLLGNAALTFISKATSGYWGVMDPTNGYTAVHTRTLTLIPLDRLEKRYFFESDLLYHLGIVRAAVVDVPMFAHYADEKSNLRISNVLFTFPQRYFVRFAKRFFYNYILRDFNAGTLSTLIGLPLTLFGLIYGAYHWLSNLAAGVATPIGTIMIAAVSLMLGVQFLVSALLFDVSNQPRQPVFTELEALDAFPTSAEKTSTAEVATPITPTETKSAL
jgi:dolichol-phosphate mannosyltransferase